MSVLAGDEVKPEMAGEFMMSSVQDRDGACLPPVVPGECFRFCEESQGSHLLNLK